MSVVRRGLVRVHRDRRRLRQAHAGRRVPRPGPRRPRHQGDEDRRAARRRSPARSSSTPSDEVLAVTSNGGVIRTRVDTVNPTGRDTMGVKLMNLKDGDSVVAAWRATPRSAEDDELDDASAEGDGARRDGAPRSRPMRRRDAGDRRCRRRPARATREAHERQQAGPDPRGSVNVEPVDAARAPSAQRHVRVAQPRHVVGDAHRLRALALDRRRDRRRGHRRCGCCSPSPASSTRSAAPPTTSPAARRTSRRWFSFPRVVGADAGHRRRRGRADHGGAHAARLALQHRRRLGRRRRGDALRGALAAGPPTGHPPGREVTFRPLHGPIAQLVRALP